MVGPFFMPFLTFGHCAFESPVSCKSVIFYMKSKGDMTEFSSGLEVERSLCESTACRGRKGEEEVALLLKSEGWQILARNFRAGRGEIDIVALKGDVLTFVEVKSWSANAVSELSQSITATKITRIVETSKIFLTKYRQYSRKCIRYDVFFIGVDGKPTRYEGAFDETDENK